MSSSFVRIYFSARLCLSEKHLLPFIRIQSAFVPNFFQKNLPSLLVAQLLRRLYEKNLVVEKSLSLLIGIKIAVLTACFQKIQKFFRRSKHPPI